jgi:hypothetical protein
MKIKSIILALVVLLVIGGILIYFYTSEEKLEILDEMSEENAIYEWCLQINKPAREDKEEFLFYGFLEDVFKGVDESPLIDFCESNIQPPMGCSNLIKGLRTGDSSTCGSLSGDDSEYCLAFVNKDENKCETAGIDEFNEVGFNRKVEKCKNRIRMIKAFEMKDKQLCEKITDAKLLAYCFYNFDETCNEYDSDMVSESQIKFYD